MIKNRRHGHLGLPTNNIVATVDWYKTVLGFEEITTFWEHGVRYFKIVRPSGEAVEFCQVL